MSYWKLMFIYNFCLGFFSLFLFFKELSSILKTSLALNSSMSLESFIHDVHKKLEFSNPLSYSIIRKFPIRKCPFFCMNFSHPPPLSPKKLDIICEQPLSQKTINLLYKTLTISLNTILVHSNFRQL